jgi:hypothetical protein
MCELRAGLRNTCVVCVCVCVCIYTLCRYKSPVGGGRGGGRTQLSLEFGLEARRGAYTWVGMSPPKI